MTFELSLQINSPHIDQIQILKQLLVSQGLRARDIIEEKLSHTSRLTTYFSSLKKAKAFQSRFQKFNLPTVQISINALNNRELKNRWKEDFKPFQLTPNFDVAGIWLKKTYTSKRREVIYIDTSFAFGTGLHDTTKFMAQFIEKCQKRINSMIDVGTGTGILSIVAYKLGIQDICAIDIDRDAVKIAKMNCANNNCPIKKIFCKNIALFKKKEKYDFVAANLITHDLIKFKRNLISLVNKGKYLAVSGISCENYKMLRREFKTLPLRCIKVLKSKQWVAVLFKRI